MRESRKGELPKRTPSQYRTFQRRIPQRCLLNIEPEKGEIPKETISIWNSPKEKRPRNLLNMEPAKGGFPKEDLKITFQWSTRLSNYSRCKCQRIIS